MRKFSLVGISVAILITGFLVLLQGCYSKPKVDNNTITLWHWMTDRHKTLEELAQRYEKETGIKVKIDLYAPSEIYSQRIIASAQARVLPDIYGILDKKKVFADFIESGIVADLTSDFQKNNNEWENSFSARTIDLNRFEEGNLYKVKPGIYGVPIDVTSIQMLYNKKLLKKAGITKIPVTFEEFLRANEALKRVGVAGLVSGFGELWMVDFFASNYALNIMGQEKVLATYRGEVKYTDPDWIKVFNVFKKMSDMKVFVDGVVTKTNKYAEQDFALERAAFAFNGSWCVNVYHDMNPDLEYGVMLPPGINPTLPMIVFGGAGSSFVVNEGSTHKDQAVAFLKWLTAKDQQIYLATETKNLPANQMALSSIPAILSDFANVMDHMTHPNVWPLDELIVVKEVFARGIQSIIVGEKTPEEVAKEVQVIKEREMKKTAK